MFKQFCPEKIQNFLDEDNSTFPCSEDKILKSCRDFSDEDMCFCDKNNSFFQEKKDNLFSELISDIEKQKNIIQENNFKDETQIKRKRKRMSMYDNMGEHERTQLKLQKNRESARKSRIKTKEKTNEIISENIKLKEEVQKLKLMLRNFMCPNCLKDKTNKNVFNVLKNK